jgi:hypothetical protein
MSCPFPNGFVTLARNARVGNFFDRYFTHLYVTEVGTKSILFKIRTICLN